ncbi:ribonuclease z [hydrocarbon metagenome]|uniref:Ribonuclease z n=1 Tax=hydrocarbon metagenome TaxID=938273 RepID=A0A0W8F451_9ZZZZ
MSGETLQVYFLGTAGALPTPLRNPPCIMVRRGSDTLLFDCGEGAQQQMMRARTGFVVDAIFVTHWHADHFLGIAGLVQTLSFIGREDPLPVYGPVWVQEAVSAIRSLSRFSVRFPLHAVQMSPGSCIPFSGYSVRAFASDHGMESLGYVLEEDSRPGRFDRERAIALGVPPGPLFGRIQRGETISITRDGVPVDVGPEDVMGPPRPGRSVVYTGDTRPVPGRIADLVAGPDLLIHDATYDDQCRDRAREVFHATAGEAGEVAAATNARILALVHISSRYTSTLGHIRDAERNFSGTVIAPSDLEMLELPFRDDS